MELADSNGLMRLMTAEKGAETPMDKYIRFKNNINLWYMEMDKAGLTKEEQKTLEPYFLSSYGVPPSQEQMMKMLMDENICAFSLADANGARKIVGKKQMSKIPELKEKVMSQAKSPALGQYVWTCGIGPQLGYSFSIIHALAYSFIGYQTALEGTDYPLYWNTACLNINSGMITEDSEGDYEEDETTGKKKSTKYDKNAKALGDIIARGIKVSLIDINKSEFTFSPDPETNTIVYGLKGVNKVGDDVINQIIAGRPYTGIKDFMNRCPVNKTIMISLIKAGAFDELDKSWAGANGVEPRVGIMCYYISRICEPKSKLNLQNFNGLVQKNLIPAPLEKCKRVFNINSFLKKQNFSITADIYEEIDNIVNIESTTSQMVNNFFVIDSKKWKSIYDEVMSEAKDWIKENQNEILEKYNWLLFKECWDKYAVGTVSAWEMDSLCFYYHKHELADINKDKYGISDFETLPSIPAVARTFRKNGVDIPIYKITKIVGTVIGKNATKGSISLLTTGGVVSVKLSKEYFANYNKQISVIGEDGKKHVVEKGWFTRGQKIMCTGFRRDDTFVCKTYKDTNAHQLYKITEINGSDIEITHDRAE